MKKIIVLLILLFIGIGLKAQKPAAEKPFVLGEIQQIKSAELSEIRTLNIYLPEGYNKDSTYPVIYLLDGSANEDFIHVTGIVQFLTMIETLPPSIVVGIANVDRKRDFTFPSTDEKDKKEYPTTGGSAKFIAFLEKELQPYIQKKYRVSETKTLIGQSLGGLLATEIVLKKPELFNNYIIVSPSLWWDNESLLTIRTILEKHFGEIPINVYISIGSEGNQMEEDAKRLVEKLRSANLKVFFSPLPEEDHLTILHNSVYKAFGLFYPKKTK